MEIKSQLMLRVNGINIAEIKLRHPAVDGHIQPDRYEVEITDPILGKFALTDECLIEIKEKSNTWRVVNVVGLISILTLR